MSSNQQTLDWIWLRDKPLTDGEVNHVSIFQLIALSKPLITLTPWPSSLLPCDSSWFPLISLDQESVIPWKSSLSPRKPPCDQNPPVSLPFIAFSLSFPPSSAELIALPSQVSAHLRLLFRLKYTHLILREVAVMLLLILPLSVLQFCLCSDTCFDSCSYCKEPLNKLCIKTIFLDYLASLTDLNLPCLPRAPGTIINNPLKQ